MSAPQAWGVALLRVVLGIIFVMHGYYAYDVLGPHRLAELIMRLGNPQSLAPAMAWYTIVAHLLGGLLLVVGLFTTVAALAQVPIMAAAVFLHHWPQGFYMRGIVVDAASGRVVAGGYEFALLVLAGTLGIALTGPGALSIDTVRDRGFRRRAIP